MILANKYTEDGKSLVLNKPLSKTFVVGWKSPSNIALIKYWGKRPVQLPENASLSFSLKSSFTETSIEFSDLGRKKKRLSFTFDGKENPAFEARVSKYLESLQQYFPFLTKLHLNIRSLNSFPHSSGIASSASSMSALALCVVSMEKQLFGTLKDKHEFMQKASFIARLGSGSASRSVFSGWVEWGAHNWVKNSSDEFALKLEHNFHPDFSSLQDAILITSSAKKKVSSSAGHELMNDHPCAGSRYMQATKNLHSLINAMLDGNKNNFIEIVEREALSLHALMMSSKAGFTLLNQRTWDIINAVRQFRNKTGLFVAFTLDAGPNVHLIYGKKDRKKIQDFINNELLQFCEEGYWIDDKMGIGPEELK